ncbi:MAG TPA: HEAT repeat domain-containing protein [Candidatus Rifleibacterium sp.]|nr:HEAT repeat domain-containing protein [Candidatus Rifleibacterium sp.]HPT46650.1 HEAT repeat domain-containing protein [Candidatus Rifleibacterium sp.]
MENSSQYFVEMFASATRQKRLDLLRKISARKDENALQFLITCFADEFWIVRKTAAEIVKEYGEAAVPVLAGALNSFNQDIQHWSLQILGELGPKGLPAILRSMKSNNDEIRYFACNALGSAHIPQGVTMLLKALGDQRWRVRKAASDSLVKYGEAVIAPLQQVLKLTDDEDIRFWAIKTLGKLGPKAQRFLLEALRNGDKQTRYVIAAALGESGDKRVIRVLIESLADPDWTIRKSATMALAEIGDNAVDMMLEYLRGPNEDIRDGCLRALVKAGNASLQRLFDEIIKMDDNHRFLIRRSIVKIGSRVVEPLMRLFKMQNPEILAFAASTLGEIGNPRAVPVLVVGLSHDDWNVRRSCAYALTEIGERGVEKIAEALKSPNDDVRYWVTRILESVGEPGVPYLVRALKDPNREIRFFAARALGSSFDPSVTRSLINSLSDEVWSVRKAAAESICRLDTIPIEEVLRHISSDNENIRHWISFIIKEVGQHYLPVIIEAMRKGDAELRLYACQAAGLINLPELIDPLILALRDDSEWVRTYAAISLGQTGDPRSLIPLIRSFSDRNTEVHRNVVSAFEKLGDKVFKELVRCIEGEDTELRRNAALALAEMRDERGVDHIVILMEDTDETVRACAAEALGSFPGLKSRTMLGEALADSALKVRLAAIKSLGELDSEADALTLMAHSAKVRDEREARTVKRTLGEMAQNNPDLFIKLFSHEQSAIKTMACDAMVAAGTDVMARLAQVSTESEDETTVFWCKKAIKQIKAPRENMFYG